MKFRTFDSENMISQRRVDAVISFDRGGYNSISRTAVERMGLAPGSLISLHQDEDQPEDWYVSLGEGGFALRENKEGGSLAFNSSAMSNTLLDALEIEDKRVAFFIANEATVVDDVEYWAVLTTKPIIRKRKNK